MQASSAPARRPTGESAYGACPLCGLGEASLLDAHAESVSILDFPLHHMPLEAERLAPTEGTIPNDYPLGTMEFTIDLSDSKSEYAQFLNDIDATQKLYHGKHAHYHPAHIVLCANQVLYRNLAIDPWIHIASDVRYHALPREGEAVALRGRIAHTYMKRGHLIALSELGFIGEQERLLAHLTHTTIIQSAWAAK